MDIGNSLQTGADRLFGFLPNIIGCLVLLVIGYIVAKIVQVALRKALEMSGVDRHLQQSAAHTWMEKFAPGTRVSSLIARIGYWFVFLCFAVAAVSALQVPAITAFMTDVLEFIPNIVVAIGIFVVAALVSGAVATGITRIMGDTPTGKIAATVLPAVVMVVALFMILEQLQIAPEIVRIAFAATMGALALGLALAFGLGGRTVAQRLLEDAYEKGREQRDQVRRDIQTGKARAEEQFRHASGEENPQEAYNPPTPSYDAPPANAPQSSAGSTTQQFTTERFQVPPERR